MHMPHSVLVVDDDPLQLEIIKEMLERNMVSCTICKTASDVVKEMRSHDYDMILSDIQMPGTDGFALFELLRKSNIGNSRDIPIIAMTARGDCETDALLEYGFASSIFKPFSMQELLEHIANIMPHKANGEHIDFSILLLEATDKISILQSLKTSCDNDISELRKATEKTRMSGYNPSAHASLSLDLRGKRFEEVRDLMDSYIDQAILANLETVSIIHGFGTGAIRKAVWEYLKHCPYAKSYRFGQEGEGLNGVTVVKLK